ncbi:MAG: sugar phosphate isomerase/epimerase [Proteobacteria bacterium]|nr:sugar phosphate isomerase/epimerase [Pseudomonadota bacterium]MBU1739820.1 sugar phosphate isomerase/epimerase [Pseudomonadota bacterium]
MTDRAPTESKRPVLFPDLTRRLFVNAPFDRLQKGLLPLFIEHGLQPEIGLEGLCLYRKSRTEFREVAATLKKAGLSCTLHAPFFDLSPGALDPNILRTTREKLKKAFALIEIFEPHSIVCHLGYEANKHTFNHADWLKNSIETWQELLAMAEPHRVPVMLENTYETGPEQHIEVLTALNSPCARFCLDAGHTLAFARNSWRDWLPPLSPWLGQLHLHDNAGDMDRHLAIGQGIFDFAGLFDYLRNNQLRPVITLEPHQEEGLWTSLAALAGMDLPDPHLTLSS